jgi:membrane protease YdiL (CAAX protease family)
MFTYFAYAYTAQIVDPEAHDLAALAVGAIAPCVTAPYWEEILYRGFLLPALTLFTRPALAVPISSVLFAVRSMRISIFI